MTQRKWRKKILALAATTMLVASNAGMVFATGVNLPSGPVEGETVVETEVNAPVEGETEAETTTEEETITEAETETTEAETTTEAVQETTAAPEQETTAAVEQETTVAPEQETTAAPEEETTPVEGETTAEGETTVEGQTTAEGETTVEGQTAVEGETTSAVGETTTVATEEVTFVNKNEEEIVPSELVGVNYEEIAEAYDGEENVKKEYVVSDEYDADIIMESYVDEDGNLVMVISQGSNAVTTMGLEATTSKDIDDDDDDDFITVDGDSSDWDDIPISYEYNWDNSSNCWQWGVWVDGECYKTEEGTYSTDVRHGMQLYADEEYVYLNVIFAREFSTGQIANGNDYQFWVDGQMAAYQVETPDGKSLSYYSTEPGTYEVDVRHRDSSWSYVLTDGAEAYYTVNEGNLNNQLELRIPLEQFVVQNGNIDLDNYSKIEFFTPNLMHNKIGCAGSPTGSIPFAAAAFTLVPTSFIWLKKKKK